MKSTHQIVALQLCVAQKKLQDSINEQIEKIEELAREFAGTIGKTAKTGGVKSLKKQLDMASMPPFSTAITKLNALSDICDDHIIALTKEIESR